MLRYLRRLAQPVTYTRWIHLCLPVLLYGVWVYIAPNGWYVPLLFLMPVGLIPALRIEEGVQAQLLLTPDERGRPDARISTTRAVTWAERGRMVLWIEARVLLALGAVAVSVWLPIVAFDLAAMADGGPPSDAEYLTFLPPHPAWALAAPVPLLAGLLALPALGDLITALACRLLGPSPKDRLAALEERTEQLLERNRIARELHDSIGHALTVAVVQAGAARAAGDPAFTERALAAIEDTGREALEDLERVLRVLREERKPTSQRPSLAEADRLFDSARASGVRLETEVTGALPDVPGPVSREGYRILQEALTNVVRHSGPVPARVRIAVGDGRLELSVTNPLGAEGSAVPGPSGGSGLRGIRERAALLGGSAKTGPFGGEWTVRASLPVDRIG
ncbi:sensor histidine kinase [Streptomyces sp. NPDC050504]|uniref:sensor histidine kinase n=1 Tax=Streptomyces sp. NPDC050504 TaxID=3365618 RepID=UPI003796CDCC